MFRTLLAPWLTVYAWSAVALLLLRVEAPAPARGPIYTLQSVLPHEEFEISDECVECDSIAAGGGHGGFARRTVVVDA